MWENFVPWHIQLQDWTFSSTNENLEWSMNVQVGTVKWDCSSWKHQMHTFVHSLSDHHWCFRKNTKGQGQSGWTTKMNIIDLPPAIGPKLGSIFVTLNWSEPEIGTEKTAFTVCQTCYSVFCRIIFIQITSILLSDMKLTFMKVSQCRGRKDSADVWVEKLLGENTFCIWMIQESSYKIYYDAAWSEINRQRWTKQRWRKQLNVVYGQLYCFWPKMLNFNFLQVSYSIQYLGQLVYTDESKNFNGHNNLFHWPKSITMFI